MGIQVLMFRISGETKSLLDPGGQWEPVIIANCPAIRGNLVGLDAYETSSSIRQFAEAGLLLTDFLRQPSNLGIRPYDPLTVLEFLR